MLGEALCVSSSRPEHFVWLGLGYPRSKHDQQIIQDDCLIRSQQLLIGKDVDAMSLQVAPKKDERQGTESQQADAARRKGEATGYLCVISRGFRIGTRLSAVAYPA